MSSIPRNIGRFHSAPNSKLAAHLKQNAAARMHKVEWSKSALRESLRAAVEQTVALPLTPSRQKRSRTAQPSAPSAAPSGELPE